MSFVPSEHSYGYAGWYDDLTSYATSKYDQAKSYVSDAVTSAQETALAPVRAAEAAAAAASAKADQVAQAAADARATAEAARDATEKAASMVPWVVGGAVLLGGYYLYTRRNRVGNPEKGILSDVWDLTAGSFVEGPAYAKRTVGEIRSARGAGAKAAAYADGVGGALQMQMEQEHRKLSLLPKFLRTIGIPI